MLRSITVISSLILAIIVLFVSIFRTAVPHYVFTQPYGDFSSSAFESGIDYRLPHPGILPDSFIWPAKASRDYVWALVTTDPVKKADLLLLFADKRIGMANLLVKKGRADLGVVTAEKGEQYLQGAFDEALRAARKGKDTTHLLDRIAKAALKHREVLEDAQSYAPEDARPLFSKIANTPKRVYLDAAFELNQRGINPPIPIEASTSATSN